MTTPAENRARLAAALRNPAPGRLPWNFRLVSRCAFCELAAIGPEDDDGRWPDWLGLEEPLFDKIFGIGDSVTFYNVTRAEDITPDMVAAALEAVE
jgi:hypothetical protein